MFYSCPYMYRCNVVICKPLVNNSLDMPKYDVCYVLVGVSEHNT